MALKVFCFLHGLGVLLLLTGVTDADWGVLDRQVDTFNQEHYFKRSLPLELEARQCRVATCPNGGCAPSLNSVCCSGGGYCDPGERCCGTRTCAPSGSTCCPDGGYAPSGYFCCPNGRSCPVGYTCDGAFCRPGSGATGTGRTSGSTPTSIRPPPPETTTSITGVTVWRWYYFTITWYYYTWYYSYDVFLGATDVFSSTIYRTTTLSVSTSNSAAASAWFTSISRTISLPTPASATPLPRPASSIRVPSSTTEPTIPPVTPIPTTSPTSSFPTTTSSATFVDFSSSSQPAASTSFAQVSANVAGRVGFSHHGVRGFESGFFFFIAGLIVIPGILLLWL